MRYNCVDREVIILDLSILWAATHNAMSVYPHTHSFYQLILCRSEGGYIGLDDKLYAAVPHRICLAKPGTFHSIDQCSHMEILEVKFNASGLLAQRIDQLPESFILKNLPIDEAHLERVSREETERGPCFDEAASAALMLFLLEAFRHFCIVTLPKPPSPAEQSADRERENGDTLILQLKDYIEVHLHEPLTLEELAKMVHFNKTYFVQRFKSLWGVPPMKYVSNLRCQKAKHLLLDTDLSVSDIAVLTGFQSPHYFSSVFRKYTGQSPNEFRSDQRKDSSNPDYP